MVIAFTVLVTLLGLGLRFYRLSNQSLWTDEVASLETARVPLGQIVERSAVQNNSPPTYFLLLRVLVGDSNRNIEVRARWLSALAGALSIPVFVGIVYLWRRHWGTALTAGLLLATNPLHLWYSQEVRAYSLMLFFGLLAVLFFELARFRKRQGWWVLYFVLALAALSLHKTAIVFPAACGLWHAWEVIRERGRLRQLGVHAAILGFALATLALKSYPPAKELGRSSSILEILYTLMTFVGGYSFGPSLTEIQSYGAWNAVRRHVVEVAILAVVMFQIAVVYVRHFRIFSRGKESFLLVLGVGIAALGALVSAFPYNIRYALPGLFGFLAVVASFVAIPVKGYSGRLCLVSMLIVGLWADAQWFYGAAYRKGDSRAVAQWLTENRREVASWTVLPDYLGTSILWYLQGEPEISARFQPPKTPQSTSFPPVPDVLIIGRRHHILRPDELIAAYKSAAGKVRAIEAFAGFEIYARDLSGGNEILPVPR